MVKWKTDCSIESVSHWPCLKAKNVLCHPLSAPNIPGRPHSPILSCYATKVVFCVLCWPNRYNLFLLLVSFHCSQMSLVQLATVLSSPLPQQLWSLLSGTNLSCFSGELLVSSPLFHCWTNNTLYSFCFYKFTGRMIKDYNFFFF